MFPSCMLFNGTCVDLQLLLWPAFLLRSFQHYYFQFVIHQAFARGLHYFAPKQKLDAYIPSTAAAATAAVTRAMPARTKHSHTRVQAVDERLYTGRCELRVLQFLAQLLHQRCFRFTFSLAVRHFDLRSLEWAQTGSSSETHRNRHTGISS